MWNYAEFCGFWRKGGNWLGFFLFWFISSAIVSTLEHTYDSQQLTAEEQAKTELNALARLLELKNEHFVNNTVNANQLEKIIQTLERPEMPRLWDMFDFEFTLVQHKLIKTGVEMFKDEFARIESNLDEDDKTGISLADEIIKILSEENTVTAFREFGEKHFEKQVAKKKEKQQKCSEKKKVGEECVDKWSFGNALHFTSTIFTTTGYGAHTTMTTVGKFITIFLIIFQIPFFLHCLATTAILINKLLDHKLGLSSKHEDLENLTTETANSQQRRLVLMKGLLILVGALLVHMLIASVYHYCTTGWTFTDVLYFDFVRMASVGFGDLIPEDEYTLAGAIFKNLLVNIPGQILTFTLFVRALPVIS